MSLIVHCNVLCANKYRLIDTVDEIVNEIQKSQQQHYNTLESTASHETLAAQERTCQSELLTRALHIHICLHVLVTLYSFGLHVARDRALAVGRSACVPLHANCAI